MPLHFIESHLPSGENDSPLPFFRTNALETSSKNTRRSSTKGWREKFYYRGEAGRRTNPVAQAWSRVPLLLEASATPYSVQAN